MAEYRIDYSITRRGEDEGDFTEIGFGSSGPWGSVAGAQYAMAADIERRQWETRPGMPDPESVDEASND